MAKEELIQFEGLVTEILPDARYRVQLDAGHEIVAYTAGKMKKNRIKTLAGDRVTIEMSPYDLEKGRLIFRHKDERPGGGAPAWCTAARPIPAPLVPIAANAPDAKSRRARPHSLRLQSRRDQKSCTSGLFWGLLWNNITISIFGRTTLAIHRYSRFRR